MKPESQSDAAYEAANLLMNVAFWMMKHAAAVAAKEDLQMEEAKEVRLKIFIYVHLYFTFDCSAAVNIKN